MNVPPGQCPNPLAGLSSLTPQQLQQLITGLQTMPSAANNSLVSLAGLTSLTGLPVTLALASTANGTSLTMAPSISIATPVQQQPQSLHQVQSQVHAQAQAAVAQAQAHAQQQQAAQQAAAQQSAAIAQLAAANNARKISTTILPSTSQSYQPIQATSSQAVQQLQTIPSLPWPLINPIISVPYFDTVSYQSVNMDAPLSAQSNGTDLPLYDISTLRFFYNLGVQQSRILLMGRAYQDMPQKPQQIAVSSAPQLGHAPIGLSAQPTLQSVLNPAALNLLPTTNQTIVGGQPAVEQQLQQVLFRAQQQQHGQLSIPQQQVATSIQPPTNQQQQQMQQLVHQAQAQMLAAAARSTANQQISQIPSSTAEAVRASHADLVALAQSQALGGTPAAAAASQLARQSQLMSSNTSPTPLPSQKSAHVVMAEQQALLLQQALFSANANTPNTTTASAQKPNLPEMRLQLMGTQAANHPSLQQFLKPTDIIKPVAVGVGSGDAELSPRPPIPIPVDPSPPRTDPIRINQQPVQAQTSPPSSTPINDAELKKDITSGNETPKSKANLFQISERHFTEAFSGKDRPGSAKVEALTPKPEALSATAAMTATEKETVKRPTSKENSGDNNGNGNGNDPSNGSPGEGSGEQQDDDNPALASILMMSYMNNYMQKAQSTLRTSGVTVGMDNNWQHVDFSSRPVDPIFKEAREELDRSRDFRDSTKSPPVKRPPLPGAILSGTPIVSTTANSTNAISTAESAVSRASSASSASDDSSPVTTNPISVIPSNPLGINRTVTDAVTTEVKRSTSGAEESDDDGPGGKRLRIATDED